MYRNCVVDGPQNDLDMYSKYGDLVVQVYIDHVEKGVTAQAVVVGAMTRMIKQIGPERVSHHCVTDWSKLHVLDISSSRIEAAKRAPFEAAIAADKRISRHFSPFTKPKDPAFHLEILQSANA